jgi:hypothetical protein
MPTGFSVTERRRHQPREENRKSQRHESLQSTLTFATKNVCSITTRLERANSSAIQRLIGMIMRRYVWRDQNSRTSKYLKGSGRYEAGCTVITAPRTSLCCSCSHLQPSREAIDGFRTRTSSLNSSGCCLTSARTEDRYTPNTPSGDCETMGYGNFTMKHISKILSPHPVTSPQPF